MSDDLDKKTGRPSKFNEDRAERLLQAVRGGNYLEVAARFAGITYPTLRRWVLKADDPDAPPEYREFKEALEKARADAEVAALAKIQKAASDGAWQAAAWYLERSWPEKWGRRDTSRVELVGDGGGPVRVVAGIELDSGSMAALAQRLAARQLEDAQEVHEAQVITAYEAELELEAGDPSSDEVNGEGTWWEGE
jgi:hypothetical protein